MIDKLIWQQHSLARRIRLAMRRGEREHALALCRQWQALDALLKDLC